MVDKGDQMAGRSLQISDVVVMTAVVVTRRNERSMEETVDGGRTAVRLGGEDWYLRRGRCFGWDSAMKNLYTGGRSWGE
ncbi:hypothetical protein Nepgr_010709 [Nepenthes gracilis]|uniref:Uncharacterized protein n=1 Tax=Nepenthes gracilis TaxID=150966 RepID=A0AAD3SDV9_NEPGR|nr:hypothetical protein Nepgr_010709 [Nepenthes gracilis]